MINTVTQECWVATGIYRWYGTFCFSVSIVVCSVPQGAKHDRENVSPAKMKLFLGFHNSFASKQTVVSV